MSRNPMPQNLLNSLRSALSPPGSSPQPQACDPCRSNPRQSGACPPPQLPPWLRRGTLPVAAATCADDEITQMGRADALWLPAYMWWGSFGRAATFSPRDPLAAAGTKAAGTLALDIAVGAGDAGEQGNRYLFPGFIFEIGTSDNVTPGVTDVEITGTFEDGQPWTQTMQFSQGHVGVSRFLVTATRITQGGSYPSLVVVENGFELTGPGDAIALTAAAAPNDATSIVPTNGIRAIERQFSVDVTAGPTGTSYRVELLSPVGRYWEWMERMFAASMELQP